MTSVAMALTEQDVGQLVRGAGVEFAREEVAEPARVPGQSRGVLRVDERGVAANHVTPCWCMYVR